VDIRKIRSLKVTTLVDNLVLMKGLLGEWGLSLLLELEELGKKLQSNLRHRGVVKMRCYTPCSKLQMV